MNRQVYYQYQPPVAMFSMADVDHKNQADFGIVNAIKEPFRRYGRHLTKAVEEKASQAQRDFLRNPQAAGAAQKAAQAQAGVNWAKANPGKLGATVAGVHGAALVAGVGAGLAVRSFIRRRRTKNGKVVVEQVRRG